MHACTTKLISKSNYLSRRRFKKGVSSSDGLRVKNSSDSPRTGRPLDPGGSLPFAVIELPQYHLNNKRINNEANTAAAPWRTEPGMAEAHRSLPSICCSAVC